MHVPTNRFHDGMDSVFRTTGACLHASSARPSVLPTESSYSEEDEEDSEAHREETGSMDGDAELDDEELLEVGSAYGRS